MSKSKKKKNKSVGKRRHQQDKSWSSSQRLDLPLSPVKHSIAVPINYAEVIGSESQLCPYDENLLERSRNQWQFGDWKSLAQLNRDTLQHHPDRAKLALLAAAGHLQQGDTGAARQFTRLAQDWGCNKKLISQILIAGVYNTLGKAAAINCLEQRALGHFEASVATGTPGGDVRLLTQARMSEQLAQARATQNRLLQESRKAREKDQKQQSVQSSNKQVVGHESQASIKPDLKSKFSSDADIDDFITDIAPFFHNRFITYVDVGAYVGEVLLKILKTKKIKIREAHLIEPNPESYQQLKAAVKDCSVPSCNTYHCGISNQPGLARFRAAKSMTKRMALDISVAEANNLFEVECRRLDDIAKVFTDGRVDILKLDVEGEEQDVLLSAGQLLREQKIDVLYVEVGLNRKGTQQTYFGDLDVMLQRYGYRVFKIYEQKNEWIENSPLLRRCNAAYMSSRFAFACSRDFPPWSK
jgi:FkbM family methyltransferase